MQRNCAVRVILLSAFLLLINNNASANSGIKNINNESDTDIAVKEETLTLWGTFKKNLSVTWNSPHDELYVPVFSWHNRFIYSDEKIKSYNELAWGLGYGKYHIDSQNNWHAVYAIAFMDSHNKVQPMAGYAWQKMWIPAEREAWRFGAGFTVGITGRHEYHYIPMPLPLPLLSIEYNRLSIQTSYIPGTRNNGNVLFALMRWQL